MRSIFLYVALGVSVVIFACASYVQKYGPQGKDVSLFINEPSDIVRGRKPIQECTSVVTPFDGTLSLEQCNQDIGMNGGELYRYQNGVLFFVESDYQVAVPTSVKLPHPITVDSLDKVTFLHIGYDSKGFTRYIKVQQSSSTTVYFNEVPIVAADSASFSLVGLDIFPTGVGSLQANKAIVYTKDKNKVYYQGVELIGADSSTFVFIPTGPYHQEYARDKNYVYYLDQQIRGADPLTFKTFSTQPYEGTHIGDYAKDKAQAYYESSVIPEADVQTFEAVILEYAKDKNHVYQKGKVIQGADPKTFEFPEPGLG